MAMTPKQLRDALDRLDISQRELGRRLRVDPRTVTRWVAGDAPVPESVKLLLECWRRDGLPAK